MTFVSEVNLGGTLFVGIVCGVGAAHYLVLYNWLGYVVFAIPSIAALVYREHLIKKSLP